MFSFLCLDGPICNVALLITRKSQRSDPARLNFLSYDSKGKTHDAGCFQISACVLRRTGRTTSALNLIGSTASPRVIRRLIARTASILFSAPVIRRSADVRNHNPNQLRLPFNKEEPAAAFFVGTFGGQTKPLMVCSSDMNGRRAYRYLKKRPRHRADDRIRWFPRWEIAFRRF